MKKFSKKSNNQISDYLPWLTFCAPGIVLQKNGALQRTYAFRGPDYQSSPGSKINAMIMQMNSSLKQLGTGWTVAIESQRYMVNDYPGAEFKNPAAYLIDRARKDNYEKSALFESSFYITFTYSGQAEKYEKFYKSKAKNSSTASKEEEINIFTRITDEKAAILSSFLDIHPLNDEETLSYLHTSISMDWHPLRKPLPPFFIDQTLPDKKIIIGDVLKIGEFYAPILAIKDFPTETFPGILDQLNSVGIEYRWNSRFINLSKEQSLKELGVYAKKYVGERKGWLQSFGEVISGQGSNRMNPGAFSQESDVDEAIVETTNDYYTLGYLSTALMVWDRDYETALKKREYVKKIIQQSGFTVMDETDNAFPAFLGMTPGNTTHNIRRSLFSSLNFSHIIPMTANWAGFQENPHMKKITGIGTPHIISTTGTTPFYFNPNNLSDVGNTLITGPIGAGKSTLLQLLSSQFKKYGGKVFILDKDRSSRQLTMAMGGHYYEPGSDKAKLSFQPLKELETQQQLAWASEFIELLLSLQKVEVTPSMKKAIHTALCDMKACDANMRTISTFVQTCQFDENIIKDALLPYTIGGTYGSIFDSAEDNFADSHWTMIEFNTLRQLGNAAVIPALSYIFNRMEKGFTGCPVLIVIDEGWFALEHPYFARKIREWLKTLRKKNVFVFFATQEIEDAAESSIFSTIKSQCHSEIYLPDEKALAPGMAEIYTKFGLSPTEINLIAQTRKKQDYYYKSVEGSRVFQLNLSPAELALFTDQDHTFLDEIEECYPREEWLYHILKSKNMEHLFDSMDDSLSTIKEAC